MTLIPLYRRLDVERQSGDRAAVTFLGGSAWQTMRDDSIYEICNNLSVMLDIIYIVLAKALASALYCDCFIGFELTNNKK